MPQAPLKPPIVTIAYGVVALAGLALGMSTAPRTVVGAYDRTSFGIDPSCSADFDDVGRPPGACTSSDARVDALRDGDTLVLHMPDGSDRTATVTPELFSAARVPGQRTQVLLYHGGIARVMIGDVKGDAGERPGTVSLREMVWPAIGFALCAGFGILMVFELQRWLIAGIKARMAQQRSDTEASR